LFGSGSWEKPFAKVSMLCSPTSAGTCQRDISPLPHSFIQMKTPDWSPHILPPFCPSS
jgi:hypothetical protein